MEQAVDLRLAEAYIPLCMAIGKSLLVAIVQHVFLNGSKQSNLLCLGMLMMDRLYTQSLTERIVDSNAIAWSVLISLMAVDNTPPSPMDKPMVPMPPPPLNNNNNTHWQPTIDSSERNSLPMVAAMILLVWMGGSMYMIVQGAIPWMHPNPHAGIRMSFHGHNNLDEESAMQCIATPSSKLWTFKEWMVSWITGVFILLLSSFSNSSVFGWKESMGYLPSFLLTSLLFSSMASGWSYLMVLCTDLHKDGRALAQHGILLILNRFSCLLYAPPHASIPWAACVGMWMVWVAMQDAVNSHPKKDLFPVPPMAPVTVVGKKHQQVPLSKQIPAVLDMAPVPAASTLPPAPLSKEEDEDIQLLLQAKKKLAVGRP